MAKAAKRRAPPEDDEDNEPAELLGGAEVPVDSAGLENLLNQLGELSGEAKVHVYRVRQGVRPPFAFLFATTAAQFAVEDVQARYGGGDYFVKAWQRGISGSLINERFAIEGEPIIARPVAVASPVAGAPPIMMFPGQQGNDAITALAGIFAQSIDRLGAMLMQQNGNRGGMKEALEMLTIAKAIVTPAGGPTDTLGMLSQLMTIMREAQPLSGEGGKADGWSLMQSAVEKVLPAIIERLPLTAPAPQLAGPPPMMPQPFPGLPPDVMPAPFAPPLSGSLAEAAAAASANVAPPAGPGATIGTVSYLNNGGTMQADPAVRAILGTYAAMFAQAATIGADPGDYAANVVDLIDASPEAEPAVRAFLMRGDWISELARQSPAVLAHREWFAALGREVLAQLDAPPMPAEGGEDSADFAR